MKTLGSLIKADFLLLVGDLNSFPGDDSLKLIEAEGFISAYDYTTIDCTTLKWRKTLEKKIEDYIYYKSLKDDV